MTHAILMNRGFVRVSGGQASAFLQGLLTCDVEKITPEQAGFGGLLTPQGKILVDFLIYSTDLGYILDCPQDLAADLTKRLGFYKLRAKVLIENLSGQFHVEARWEEPGTEGWNDPRHAGMGQRILREGPASGDEAAYQAHRISLGVAQGGIDYVYGDTFPHEGNFDRFGGVDFTKGCYIGQEVVSRMEHKTHIRKRVVDVTFSGEALTLGAEVTAGELAIGRMGSSVAGMGLALLRLDRAEAAKAENMPILVEGCEIRVGQGQI